MRIVHFIEWLPCGGLGSVAHLLHQGATAAGHDSHVIAGGCDPSWVNWRSSGSGGYEDLGLPKEEKVFWKWRWRRRLRAALEARLRILAPEVIHVHQVPALILAAPVLRRLQIPCLLTIHGMVPAYAGPGWRRLRIRTAFRRALALTQCRCVAVSAAAARYVEQGLGLAPGRVLVQPNPLDVDRFSSPAQPTPPPRTVLMVSRLVHMKRVQDGVRALALLDNQPEIRLRIAGHGPMRGALEALAAILSMRPRVDFLGVRKDIPDLLREAGVLWHLSKHEGGPMAVLEAMAAGLPVVVTDVPGTGEVVKDGVNGLVVPLGDPRAVAEATRRLWSDDELRRRVIAGGLATAAEHRMERVAADYVAHYERARSCEAAVLAKSPT